MKFLIISGNPKKDGLCKSVEDAVIKGIEAGGGSPEVLGMEGITRCRCCREGWGNCLERHTCGYGDDGFTEAQNRVNEADALCLITPVYWGEMAEGIKSFLDRLRRCEFRREGGALTGKPVLLIASPGGTGNGMLTCLEQMDRFCRHTGMIIFDYIGINRWNNDYKREAAYKAAKAMTEGRKAGDTL
ncbi:MAG: flavodoxin family protein [Clostridiales bacterium]|jgi:multimeric flavodoxin WrbA|nr:flavodoxin family protein [Clostridiales bacterium]